MKESPFFAHLKLVKFMNERQHTHTLSPIEHLGIFPSIHFLYDDGGKPIPQTAHLAADTIARGGYIIPDYLTTYGTAYSNTGRDLAFLARKETSGKPSSVVARYSDARHWIDTPSLTPLMAHYVRENKLQFLIGICFFLFPGNNLGNLQRPLHDSRELQVFFTPDTDPILTELKTRHHLSSYLVTSSNFPTQPEKYTAFEAYEYARHIASPLFVIHSLSKLQNEAARQRVGSQPIVELPTHELPQLTIRRLGNTSFSTMKRLLESLLSHIPVSYLPFKPENRPTYDSPPHLTHHTQIVTDLLRASRPEEV